MEPANDIQEKGHEFGTTTGRKRRIGWIDLPLLRYAHQLNGFKGIHYTKLDVLGGVAKIKVAVAHKIEGKMFERPSLEMQQLDEWEPVYETVNGFENLTQDEWREVVRESKEKGLKALPENAFEYIKLLERELGIQTKTVSVGAERGETIFVKN